MADPITPIETKPGEGKALIASWEFWANVVGSLVYYFNFDKPEGYGWLPPKYAALIPLLTAAVTVLLRYLKTSQPITGVFKS